MKLLYLKSINIPGLNAGYARYYVSDLHAGDGGPADDFLPRAALFHLFAESVGWENLVFVGDILEGWQDFSESDIARAHPLIHSSLVSRPSPLLAVHGNHDRSLADLPARLDLGGICIMHGHQADPWNSRYRLCGRLLTWIAGLLERVGWRDADDPLAWDLPSRLTGARWRRWSELYHEPWALGILSARSCGSDRSDRSDRSGGGSIRLLICGHTHRASLIQLPSGQAVANCGTWASSAAPCTAIRVAGESVDLLEVRQ